MPANLHYTHQDAFDATTITVSNTTDLNAAIAALSGSTGGTILVDNTSDIPLYLNATNLGHDGQPVLIRALDPEDPPHFQQMDIVNSSHLTISGMYVNSENIAVTRADWLMDINVRDSSEISITDTVMEGNAEGYITVDNGVTWGERAVMLRDSEDITFSHNTLTDYRDGITYQELVGLDISFNEISGIQGDGMRGGGLQDVTITNNYLHDFHGSSQDINHSDMIQIWGTNAQLVTKNVEISGNILDAGNGAATQSILILNEDFDRTGYYENISVHDNVIHNAQAQGIGTDHVLGLEVYDNTVLWNNHATTQYTPDQPEYSTFPRLIIRDSPDAYVEGNITAPGELNGADLEGTDNIVLSYKEASSEFYAGGQFVNLSNEGDQLLADLALRPDSPWFDQYGAELSTNPFGPGSEIVYGETTTTIPVIGQLDLEGARTGVELSAEFSLVDGAPITADSHVRWLFSDGTEQEGMVVTHFFDGPGSKLSTLEITSPSGEVSTVSRHFTTEETELFELDFANGIVDLSSFDSELEVFDTTPDSPVAGRDGSAAFDLTGRDRVHIDRDNIQFTNLETFKLDVGFQLGEVGSSGTLSMLHKVFKLEVDQTGRLSMELTTDTGGYTTVTDEPVLTDTDWHDISVVFDSPAGKLDILLDGELVGSGEGDGSTTGERWHDIVLGSEWTNSVTGTVDHFALSAPNSEIYTQEPEPEPEPTSIFASIANALTAHFQTIAGSEEPIEEPGPEPEPNVPVAPLPNWGASLFDILTATADLTEDAPLDVQDDEDALELELA